jgi:drug/metabolite transporter (DMT)-like permease
MAELIIVCGTTLMNVGLILTPVSVYQMSRGALVLWVGVLSVIFLRRRLWLYQWAALIIVTLGVCLVGLSGSLVKKDTGYVEGILEIARSDDDPAKVALGVGLILFAQVFTASQFVSRVTTWLIPGGGGEDYGEVQGRTTRRGLAGGVLRTGHYPRRYANPLSIPLINPLL